MPAQSATLVGSTPPLSQVEPPRAGHRMEAGNTSVPDALRYLAWAKGGSAWISAFWPPEAVSRSASTARHAATTPASRNRSQNSVTVPHQAWLTVSVSATKYPRCRVVRRDTTQQRCLRHPSAPSAAHQENAVPNVVAWCLAPHRS